MISGSRELGTVLAEGLGPGVSSQDPDGSTVTKIWTVSHVEVALAESSLPDRSFRAQWRKRQGDRATPLLLVAPAGESARVLGPSGPTGPIRLVGARTLVKLLQDLHGMSRQQAASTLAAALERLDRSGIPGVIVRGLLTKHVLTRRLQRDRPEDWAAIRAAAARIRPGKSWNENFVALGYTVERRPEGGYLLRYGESPVAVVHPLADPAAFTRLTDEGQPPEGLLVADATRERVGWGLLASDNRFRLFPAATTVGAATGRYVELDLQATDEDSHAYLGLLAPESLEPGGLLDQLIEDSVTHGNELREDVERRLRDHVLPSLAQGIGAFERAAGYHLTSPDTRKLIEDAALLLQFRLLFFLYLEGRSYLPLSSPSYAPHSATMLLRDAREQVEHGFGPGESGYWSRLETLIQAMRTGSTTWGLPAYNGDLFDPKVLHGAELLGEVVVPDEYLGPALAAMASDPAGESAEAGIDYGDLEIAHLGRIYEGLLSLRLSLATEPLAYNPKTDRYVPAGKSEPEITPGELFFQTESGGRKAAGVYYTPQVIVRQLVNQAVRPALEEHLQAVAEIRRSDQERAVRALFDFKVLDPAMGSAHFLADALDVVAERIATFLAEHPLRPVRRLLDSLRAEAKWTGAIEDSDLLRRLVLKRCIYGVDLSDMAVEVGKISLWLASFVPGLSLAYLGHNLQHGDSLVGVADPAVLSDLGPFAAAHENAPIPRTLRRAREVALRLEATTDSTPEEYRESLRLKEELDGITADLGRALDVWTAEPFGLKGARDWLVGAAEKLIAGEPAKGEATWFEPADEMGKARRFFHWPLAFPEVFMRDPDEGFPEELGADRQPALVEVGDHQLGLHEAAGRRRPGFDVVIGNPPWEELTVEELAFYTLYDPGVRGLTSEAERRGRMTELAKRYPLTPAEFDRRKNDLEEKRKFFTSAGGYTASKSGDPDLYKFFCERYRSLTREGGWLGVVLPRSAFLAKGSRGFRRWLFGSSQVHRLDFILNNRSWAFPIHPQYTIALPAARRTAPSADARFRESGPSASQAAFQAAAAARGVPIAYSRLKAWSELPDGPGYEVPLLPSADALEVFDRMRRGPRFDEGYQGAWSAFPVRELDETNDRRFFRHKEGVPVWKGRSFDQFDPHGREPAGYADETEAIAKLQSKRLSSRSAFKGRFPAQVLADPATHPFYTARVAFRDVSRATDSRTVRACLVPPRTFLTNKAPYLVFPEGGPREQAFVLGVLNSLPFDWQARRYVETAMNFFILNMFGLPPPDETDLDAIAERAARLSCPDERFADFAEGCRVDLGQLTQSDCDRLRAEIDALVARAYRLSAADLEVIFADFTQNAVPDAHRALVREAFDQLR